MADLLPCPFCGGDDITLDFKHPVYTANGREFSARCEDCGCEGPHTKDPRDGWYMRPEIKEGAILQHSTINWIPVSEKLPSSHKHVLVLGKAGSDKFMYQAYCIKYQDNVSWYDWCGDTNEELNGTIITHWQPLLELPKEDMQNNEKTTDRTQIFE